MPLVWILNFIKKGQSVMTDIQLKLRLIETPNQPKPDYLLIYNRIIFKKLTEAMTPGLR